MIILLRASLMVSLFPCVLLAGLLSHRYSTKSPRRWIIQSDWLEAVIAMPTELFYNTGIATYIWIVTNRKPEHRR
ncbi:MAG: N-6 DNA methylase, partial [Nitrospirae bacterium]|nr:N-6 DNA methylase [Nitrospirota bacterium]